VRNRTAVLAAILAMAPLGAKAADLVVWWEESYTPAEDAAVHDLIATFERETGKQIELVRHDADAQTAAVQAAIDAGHPPDFLFGEIAQHQIPRWAEEGRLVDLTDTIGSLKDLFDAQTIELSTLHDARDGRTGIYAIPMARDTTHLHVWKSLLEQAGLSMADIPMQWDAFWSFWCDRAQPAVRNALGRDDIWGAGLAMSTGSVESRINYTEFQLAYGGPWAGGDGQLQVEDPAVRARMVQALASYTSIYRKGCTPPDSIDWTSRSNNEAFVAQRVLMTINITLSYPILSRKRDPTTITTTWRRSTGRATAMVGRSRSTDR
jgi:multiple sugar transport system substrate-binding protein